MTESNKKLIGFASCKRREIQVSSGRPKPPLQVGDLGLTSFWATGLANNAPACLFGVPSTRLEVPLRMGSP